MIFPDRPRRNDLAWQAFRYVGGEMDGREADAFEHRLEHDPAACAAVAEAVELTGALALIGGENLPGRRARRRLPVALVALAATLLVGTTLTLLMWSSSEGPGERGGQLVGNVPSSETSTPLIAPADSLESQSWEHVALAWVDLRGHEGLLDDSSRGPELTATVGDSSIEDSTGPSDAVDDLELPSWMLELAALGDVPGEPEPTLLEN